MPIAKLDPLKTKVASTRPKTEPVYKQDVVVDTKETPISSLLTAIGGYPWGVKDYFQQVINTHTTLAEHDVYQSGVYQQYYRIKQLELRVNDPVNYSFDNATGVSSGSGSATLYPGITPNVGDMFVADAGKGQYGYFTVTSSTRKSINSRSLYEIEYELTNIVERGNDTLWSDLVSKVIETFVFDKKRLLVSQTPKIEESVYKDIQDLQVAYERMIEYYYRKFYSDRAKTFILDLEDALYDESVVDFFTRIVSVTDTDVFEEVTLYKANDDMCLNTYNVFDALLDRNDSDIKSIDRQCTMLYKSHAVRNGTIANVRFVPIDAFLSSSKEASEVQVNFDRPPLSILERKLSQHTSNGISLPDITPIDFSSYVLSTTYYTKGNTNSILELLIRNYFNGTTLSVEDLVFMTKRYKKWCDLDGYYYIPILIMLVKTFIVEGY